MSDKVVHVESDEQFKSFVNNDSPKITIVDFSATWCGPCKQIAPKFEEFAKQNPDKNFLKVDVDELAEVAEEYGVTAMPTFIVLVNGKKVDELVGANPNELSNLITRSEKYL